MVADGILATSELLTLDIKTWVWLGSTSVNATLKGAFIESLVIIFLR